MAAKETALEALDAKRLKESVDLRARVDAAATEYREAQTRLTAARGKLGLAQRDNVNASFAYDAERARLVGPESKAA